MQYLTATPTWTTTAAAGTTSEVAPPPIADERTDPARGIAVALVLSAASWAVVIRLALAASSV